MPIAVEFTLRTSAFQQSGLGLKGPNYLMYSATPKKHGIMRQQHKINDFTFTNFPNKYWVDIKNYPIPTTAELLC